MDLTNIRKEIDSIDDEILRLLCRRMDLMDDVANYKSQNNMPIYQRSREEEVINRAMENCPLEYKEQIRLVFQSIMDAGKELQKKKH